MRDDVIDAWFDVLTSSTRAELVVAVSEAALVELPLAVLCLLLARNAERRLQPLLDHLGSAQPRLRLIRGDPQAAEPSASEDRLSA